MPRRTLVDPEFPARLRQLRQAQGLSLRDLSRSAYVGKSTLSQLENGNGCPSLEMARHLDQVLNAGGELAGMVTEPPADPETDERVAHALARPARIDAAAVDGFASVLAAQRRLDDALESHTLLPAIEPQWRTVAQLADDVRGPHAERLRAVVAEWTQFVGWLLAEARHDARAIRVLTEAAAQADAVDDGTLAAQAENFRGYIERQRGNPRGIVRHFLTAYQTPGATALQRVGDAVQAAHGYALLGDRRMAEQLLAEASNLTEQAERETAPAAAYWLSPTFSRMSIGLAHLALGNRAVAANHLRAGLDGLPAEHQGAEWTGEYRQALATAVQ